MCDSITIIIAIAGTLLILYALFFSGDGRKVMPDITMCLNHSCKNNKNCYRYTAKPNEWRQAYSEFAPDGDGNCVSFTPNDLEIKRRYETRDNARRANLDDL
jgi:hypothetical protein